MQIDILTLFPGVVSPYLEASLLQKAIAAEKVTINVINIRDWAKDKHHTTDDTPYGGGPGMVLKVEPIFAALKSIGAIEIEKENPLVIKPRPQNEKIIMLSPGGKMFDQKMGANLSKLNRITLLCGRYEGFDDRIKLFIDAEVSVGNFVLTGGELPALIITDVVTRFLPGVVGNEESIKNDTFFQDENYVKHPQYTKPEEFMGMKIPEVLISGNHQAIEKWRKSNSTNK
ncbi:MAG: tRNA (guanosine(37)-N1)-methyltransferase TrmD [bacterium]